MHDQGESRNDWREVIERLRAGDHAAFDAIVRAYHAPLYTYLLRLTHSGDVANDLLQDMFFRVWKTRATVRPDANLRAYLYTAARHHAFSYLRGRRSADAIFDANAGVADILENVPQNDGTSEDSLDRAELTRALAEAVAGLPPRCREIWILSRDHGLSYPEIAQATGISVNTVKTQMGRAMRVLRAVAEPLLIVTVLARS